MIKHILKGKILQELKSAFSLIIAKEKLYTPNEINSRFVVLFIYYTQEDFFKDR